MSKQFTVRVLETIVRDYTFDAEDEDEARAKFFVGDVPAACLEVDTRDQVVQSVTEDR